ncbi:hypothetical protein [Sphingomonas sp. NFX23]|uniref:hypothetical protein n=1 Tax=Sphingomonas sp. NFX23 TaxID=2819532 RepID=UPI003CF69F74
MSTIRLRPLFTTEFEGPLDLALLPGGTYIYSTGEEPRSKFSQHLHSSYPTTTFVKVTSESSGSFSTDLAGHGVIHTRRRAPIETMLLKLPDPIYLDITGLDHATWAPFVRVCIEAGRELMVVYMEPASYSSTSQPDRGIIYDLSERIGGIRPLPQFAKLEDRRPSEACFVPLLGFEGARFLHMLNEVDPSHGKVFPVLGIPGFMPHYPLDSVVANAVGLEQEKAIRNLSYAKSNCPFSLYYEIERISKIRPDDLLRVGLIGTKPHALGAVLFAIANDDRTEIVYDNVLRRAGRTRGVRRCLVYSASDFLKGK